MSEQQPERYASTRDKSGPAAEDRVLKLIMAGIDQQSMPPGHRLVERELAEGANANRQAVRNALLRLAQAGLIKLIPNKGATVSQSSPEKIQEIMQARVIAEGAALKILAEILDQEGAERLQGILRREAAAYDDARVTEGRHMSREFHVAFAELAGNASLARFARELIACQPLLGVASFGPPTYFSGVIAHTKTLAALRSGDGDMAVAANTELLRALEREFLREAQAQERTSETVGGPR